MANFVRITWPGFLLMLGLVGSLVESAAGFAPAFAGEDQVKPGVAISCCSPVESVKSIGMIPGRVVKHPISTNPPVAACDDAKKETEVDGRWRLTKYVENGKVNDDEIKADYQIIRKDGVQEITKGGKLFSKRKFEIDPGKSPKHIDFIDDNGARVGGVYEIDGDEMRVAILADPERRKLDRPSDLTEKGNILAAYKRVQGKRGDNAERDLTPEEAAVKKGESVTVRMVVLSVLSVLPDGAQVRLVSKDSFKNEKAFVIHLSTDVLKKLKVANGEKHFLGKTIRVTGKVQSIIFSSTPETRPGINVEEPDKLEIIERP